jgi:hypothetical protein
MTSREHTRRPLGLALSIALHGGVLYGVWQVPWSSPAALQPRAPAALSRVVWMRELPALRAPSEPTLDPALEPGALIVADTAVALVHPTIPTLPIRPDLPPPPRSAPEPRRPRPGPDNTAPAPEAPQTDRGPSAPTEPESTANEPAPDSSGRSGKSLPEVDWEKERRDAIESVLEERARAREPLTFSQDDVIEKPEPIEPSLPPLVSDHCVIVKNKLQRFAALMTGRCVREARGDLFALIKPQYLKSRPVCVETRPESPGSFLSDGRMISTVKCELVAEEDGQ